jgi:restriction system protein
MNQSRAWVVRGGDYNELASQVKSKKAVAIGWSEVGDLAPFTTRDELRAAMEEAVPSSGTPNAVGQAFRFAKEISHGDYILTPEKITAEIHISQCVGPYRHDPSLFGPGYPNVRPVQYFKAVPRKHFPQAVRNTLGSTLTVFRADVALPHIEAALGKPPSVPKGEGEELREPGVWAEEIDGQARGQILESLNNIDHHDFQVFIAGLLQALGYRVTVGKKGADGGVDILAHPDQFGLTPPRIKVQVKNQKSLAGVQDVGYLNGVLGAGERGLFVCTGGFSRDAQNIAFVVNGQVALVDDKALLDLITEHYEQMPPAAKALLPLRRLYVPEKPSG